MKKIISLILCLLLCSTVALADASFPVEGSDAELTLAVFCPSDSGPSENMWFWHYISQTLGININVIEVQDAATYKSLSMASGDMPDAFFGCSFTTTELVRYGGEGMLLDFTPYITEEKMPNLAKFMSDYDLKSYVSTADGAIYSLYYVQGQQWKGVANGMSIYYDTEAAAAAGYTERPETWDEMYAMMKAVQESKADVEGYYVFGGSEQANNPLAYLLNAVGYLTRDPFGSKIAMKGDAPVIPANDDEGYTRYIHMANQLYKEGLMDPDFFTLDSTSVLAKLQSGQYGMFQNMQTAANPPENWIEWESVPVLKGELTGTQVWPMVAEYINGMPLAVNIGGFVVNAETENLDAVLRFADWFYGGEGENYYIYWCGETAENVQAQNLYYDGVAFSGWTLDESGAKVYTDEGYNRNVNLVQHEFFALGHGINYTTIDQYLAGWADDLASINGNVTLNDSTSYNHCETSNVEYHDPYFAQGYPMNVFFDEATAERVNELTVIIDDYVKAQAAAFIVGQRSLDELPAFFEELDSLGIDELEGYYVDYYNAVK